jgi:hypothetical protein
LRARVLSHWVRSGVKSSSLWCVDTDGQVPHALYRSKTFDMELSNSGTLMQVRLVAVLSRDSGKIVIIARRVEEE